MEITYHVSEEDYINFNIDHWNRSKSMGKNRRILQIGGAVGIFLIGSIAFDRVAGYDSPILRIAVALMIALVWFFYFPRALNRSIVKTLKKMLQKNSFTGKQTISLEEDCFVVTDTMSTTKTSYESIDHISSGHDLFYIYTGTVQAVIIPLAAFRDACEKDRFFALLQERSGLGITNDMRD